MRSAECRDSKLLPHPTAALVEDESAADRLWSAPVLTEDYPQVAPSEPLHYGPAEGRRQPSPGRARNEWRPGFRKLLQFGEPGADRVEIRQILWGRCLLAVLNDAGFIDDEGGSGRAGANPD